MATNANYDYHTTEQAAPTSPYGSGDPYYNKASGYIGSGAATRPKRNWLKIAIPVAILVIVGAVVGGVLGSRSNKKSNGGGSSGNNGSNGNPNSDGPVKNGLGRFPTSTDPVYGMPIYPSSVSLRSCVLGKCGNIAVLNFFSLAPPSPSFLGWTIDLWRFLPFSATRPTPPSMANRRFPPTLRPLGPAIPSAPEPHQLPPCAQIALDLSLPDTSGVPFRTSLPTIHTSQLGTNPFSTTPPNTIMLLLSSTTWMATAVSLTTPEKSR